MSEFQISFSDIADICGMETPSSYELVVHGCNAQGVMGSGVAAQLRAAYPIIFEPYSAHCRAHNFNRSSLGTFCPVHVEDHAMVINMITQEHFGKNNVRYVDYEAVYNGFSNLKRYIAENEGTQLLGNYRSHFGVHFPLIGAGLAHGDWSIIQQCIKSAWANSPYSLKTETDLILHLQP